MDPERSLSTPLALLLRRRTLTILAGALLGGLTLTGCEEGSTQLEERVNQLHSELEKTQGELQDAKRALANANDELAKAKNDSKPSGNSSGGGLLDKAKLEETYMSAARDMRKEVEAKLKGFTIETCTLHNVRMPESVQPYSSDISLALRSTDGNRPYRVTLPVKADFTGKWIFPSADEIVGRIEASKNVSNTADNSSSSSPSSITTTPPAVMESNGTVVIQWPGANNSTASSLAPAPVPSANVESSVRTAPDPAPAPRSNNSSAPAQVMPVNKDVLIKF